MLANSLVAERLRLRELPETGLEAGPAGRPRVFARLPVRFCLLPLAVVLSLFLTQ